MKSVLCFGDSNTYGFNPEFTSPMNMRFPKGIRWCGVLQQLLGSEYEIVEEGLGGRTTVWEDPCSPGRNGLKELVPLLQSHQPLDLVILMLGTNDTKREYNASAMAIGRGMEELVKTCLNPYVYDTMKPPKILVISPVPLGKRIADSWLGDIFDSDSAARSAGLANVYHTITNKYGCEFLDAAKVAKVSEADSVHLGIEDHKKLAEAVADKVREQI